MGLSEPNEVNLVGVCDVNFTDILTWCGHSDRRGWNVSVDKAVVSNNAVVTYDCSLFNDR